MNSPEKQARAVLEKIRIAVEALGGSLADVVRIRTYISDASYVESVALVQGEVFRDINPANTLVQAGLIGEGVLVEIEAEAVLDGLPNKP
jgi:enamine deaminase RidA (YjgF/YER057c/UK114 family)